jgi:hypothetical protein
MFYMFNTNYTYYFIIYSLIYLFIHFYQIFDFIVTEIMLIGIKKKLFQ